jgi:hypothetical protein
MPVYLDNMNRILPKGESLPVPMLSRALFGRPIKILPEESKTQFLERARAAVLTLAALCAGGILSATAVGTALWWATPFSLPAAAAMSLAITLSGFAGGLILSAIKRDRGVKDYGTLIAGHGGMLDRIDSLCFAAPIFFHLTRYFFT